MIVAFVAGVFSTANACNYSSITLVGAPIDNGNGTYTITLDVCVGLMISWGGTTDFTLTLSGGSFTSVASIQTPTFNTAYSYCSANCVGNTCPGSLLSGGCASPIVNGGNTLDFTGCGNSPGNWIAPDDYAAVCVTNPNNLCQTVTFTTNGYPGSISMEGVEDDFGPTAGNGGGCPETLTLPQPSISTCTGTFYDSGGSFGDYSNSENATYTYCSDNGGPIVFDFTYFNIENGWDFLYVFDGPSTASPMLGTYTGTIGPGTITSTGTCFTFVFQSDGSVTAPGWEADISCPTNCVDPVADFFTSSQKCTGSGFDFFNTGSSGSGYTYSWSFPSATPSSSTDENPVNIVWNTSGFYTVTLTVCDATDPNCCTSYSISFGVGNGPAISTSSTDVLCFGDCNGTVSATASGGTAPYTYDWTTLGIGQNQVNVCAGTYPILVTDNYGCFDTASVQVQEPNEILLTASSIDESCSGACDGQVSANATGGSGGPYTFVWNNGLGAGQMQNGVCSGNYLVSITDGNGCSATPVSVTVNSGAGVNAGFTYNGNQCLQGNSYCFTNTGGTGLSYSWDFGDGLGVSNLENPCYTYLSAGTYTVLQTVTDGTCNDTYSLNVTVFSPPVVSINGIDVNCNGVCNGAATLNISGGVSPYSYSWSNSSVSMNQTGLCAGTYTVTVTDANGCIGAGSVQIAEPPAITSSITGVDASCNGTCDGVGTVTVSGGLAPYTYLWDDPTFQTNASAIGLCSGLFHVRITDANGCASIVDSVIISEPSPIVLSISTVDATCGLSDGSASVSVSGGLIPYTYSWGSGCVSSSCISLSSGTYAVTVTDANGCNSITTAIVNDGVGGNAIAVMDSLTSCVGSCDGVASATISGGTAPFTYLWDNTQTTSTANGLCAGIHNVSITDAGGCVASASVTITEPTAISLGVVSSADAPCNGVCNGSVNTQASGGSGLYTYSWSPSGGNTSSGTGLCAGISYTVSVYDENGCFVSRTLSINEPSALSLNAIAAPTSCNGGADGVVDLSVSGGTTPYSYSWSNGLITEDISGLLAGTYVVTVTDASSCSDTTSVIVGQPAALSLSSTITDAYCSLPNGSICVVASGGTLPYTYLWNDPSNQITSCASLLDVGTYSVLVTDVNGCTANLPSIINNIPGANAMVTLDNNATGFGICDGQATATMPGILPFSYSWNTIPVQSTATANGLCAGQWCVTVTDSAGCTSSDCISITQPPQIGILLTGSNIDCNGNCVGAIDISVSGGVLPYSYLWSGPNSFTSNIEDPSSLCAGYYGVTVTDANSVNMIDSIEILEPVLIAASVTGVDVTCYGGSDGSASVVATGGVLPYTYAWNDIYAQTTSNATVLDPQSYTVTVTDSNGCIDTASVLIGQPVEIVVGISSQPSVCGQNTGSITATPVNGIAPYTYSWDNGCNSSQCNSLLSGNYNVVIVDANGCQAIASGNVADISGPSAVMFDSTDVSCLGLSDGSATVSVTDGTPPYTYMWSTVPIQTNASANGLASGLYTVVINDANNCNTTVQVGIDEPTPISVNATVVNDPSCYGISDGIVSCVAQGGTGSYTYSWTGGCIAQNCGGMSAGIYGVTVTDGNSCDGIGIVELVDPPQLGAVLSSNDILCAGECSGNAIATPMGGSPNYTYQWSNGDTTALADSLCIGLYTLSLSDANGCLSIKSITLSQPSVVDVSIPSSAGVGCYSNCDGYAQTVVSGGTPPYNYLWSNSDTTDQIVSLCAGTYVVSVTDVNFCLDTASIVIVQTPPVTLSVITNDVSCYSYCNGSAIVTVSGGTSPYSYLWDDPYLQTTNSPAGLCGGVYGVTVTDANGCLDNASISINEPQVLGLVENSSSSNCGNNNGQACVSVIGGVLPYTIQWNDPNNTVGSCIDSIFSGVYNPLLTDGNGCQVSQPVIVNDISGPVIDSVIVNHLNCYGDSNGTATGYISGGVLPYDYFWKNNSGDTLISGIANLTGLSGGLYTITAVDSFECKVSSTVLVDEPLPLVSAILSYQDVSCIGFCDGSAQVMVANGVSPYTYSWAPSGGSSTYASGLCQGLNTVTITDLKGCQLLDDVLINSPNPLVLSVSSTDVTCNGGNNATIDVVASGGQPPYSYLWMPLGTGYGVGVSNLYAGNYQVQVMDLNGCDTSEMVVVNEPSAMSMSGGSNPSTCGNSNGSSYVTVSGGTSPYSYFWYDDIGISLGQFLDTAVNIPQGIYNCQVIDSYGCISDLNVPVNDVSGPIVGFESIDDVLCYGLPSGSASANVVGGTFPFSYQWDDVMQQTTKEATGLYAGVYNVVVTDFNNCKDSSEVTLTEPDEIGLFVTGTATICNGQVTTINAIASGGTGTYNYNWSNSLSDTAVHFVSPSISTTYTVIVNDTNNCLDTATVTIGVYPALVVSGTGDIICEGEDAHLSASVSGGNGTYTYNWVTTGGVASAEIVTGILSDTSFVIVLSDNCSENDTDTVHVMVKPIPPVPVSFNDSAYCYGSVIADLYANGIDVNWYGDINLTNFLAGGDYLSITPSVGNNEYYATQTIDGCESEASSVIITIYNLPTAQFYASPPSAPIAHPVIDFVDTSSTDVISWSWDFGDGSVIDTNFIDGFFHNDVVSHYYTDSGSYVVTLTVVNDNGCVDVFSSSIDIKMEYIFFVPSAFSPNGDGTNDYFLPKGLGIYNEGFKVQMYDRWGDLIYQYNDSYGDWIGWDGTANGGGDIVHEGVYVWKITTLDINGLEHEYIGHVTVIK